MPSFFFQFIEHADQELPGALYPFPVPIIVAGGHTPIGQPIRIKAFREYTSADSLGIPGIAILLKLSPDGHHHDRFPEIHGFTNGFETGSADQGGTLAHHVKESLVAQ